MTELWSCPVCREKDAEIERLTAELAALRESLRWKPVTEPPTREEVYLVRLTHIVGVVDVVVLDVYKNGSFLGFGEKVTAWREILDGEAK